MRKSAVLLVAGLPIVLTLLAGCQNGSAGTSREAAAAPKKSDATSQQAQQAIEANPHIPPQARAAIIAHMKGQGNMPGASGAPSGALAQPGAPPK